MAGGGGALRFSRLKSSTGEGGEASLTCVGYGCALASVLGVHLASSDRGSGLRGSAERHLQVLAVCLGDQESQAEPRCNSGGQCMAGDESCILWGDRQAPHPIPPLC